MKKMLLTVMLLAVAMNAHALNVDQVMTASFDSSAGAIKVQWAKNDAEIISALTNTVQTVFDVKHTTTGVPANGIGAALTFTQETSAANNEIGMAFQALTTDVTLGSEDFDFVLKLMAAGSAAAEKLRITSTGILTLAHAATIDNSTNGTIAIAEPTIYLNGAVKSKVCTLIADDTTPDVTGCTVLETVANSGATAITDLDNPVVGSIVILVGTSATNSPTIADAGNFALSGAWTGSVDETLTLYIQADNDYIELTRSTN